MKRDLMAVALAAVALGSAAAGHGRAQQTGRSKAVSNGSSEEALQRGKTVFDKKCALCHYATSSARKIGPGLKGMSKRGTFLISGRKVTDESLKEWIEKGDNLMPPFKDVLDTAEFKDVIRYIKTL